MMPLLELVRRRDLFPHINKKRKATVYSNVEDELARLTRWHCRRSGRSVSRNSSGKARHFLQEHQADLALQKLSCDKPLPATNLGQLQKMLVAACIPNDLLPDFGSPRTGTSGGRAPAGRSREALLRHAGRTSHGGVTQTKRTPANPGRFRVPLPVPRHALQTQQTKRAPFGAPTLSQPHPPPQQSSRLGASTCPSFPTRTCQSTGPGIR